MPGAETDMARLAAFMNKNQEKIDKVIVSQDSHDPFHIGHPCFFTNRKSEHPKPFTQITYKDLRDQKWMATEPKQHGVVTEYLKLLEDKGRYTHTIWPYHCLNGHWGKEIVPEVFGVFDKFNTTILVKGNYKFSEEYSIMGPEVYKFTYNEYDQHNAIFTIESIYNSDKTLVSGEAGSHCVASSLLDIHDKLIMDGAGHRLKDVILLEDTTSPVTGFNHLQKEAIKKLVKAGMRISNTEEMTKELS